MDHLRREYWEAKVHLREMEDSEPYLMANFSSREMAEFAIRWAYECRLEELRTRPEAKNVETSLRGSDDLKITWWKEVLRGYSPQKDYFYVTPKTLDLVIL